MSSTGKRLDLRFGAFACSVQGFDDPVQPVQQILRAIQHLLEESPELSDTAINFDAEAIEQLTGEVARRAELDEREVEIVPGLVIIHHGAGGDLAAGAAAGDGAFWQAEVAEDTPGDTPGDAREDARELVAPGAGGYVNIFTPGGDAAERGAEDGGDAAGHGGEHGVADAPGELAARLRRAAADAGLDWDDAGDAESDPEDDWQAPKPRPRNLFAAGETAAGEAVPDARPGDDPAPGRNLFAVVEGSGEGLVDDHPGHDAGASEASDWPGSLLHDAAADDGEADDAGEGYTAADFAARAEARSVPELMLAAAAWMVLIKGQTQFTRRDVLDVFDTIPGEHENTPEARIKGFGKAVRNGHLVMIEEGIFGISRDDLEGFKTLL